MIECAYYEDRRNLIPHHKEIRQQLIQFILFIVYVRTQKIFEASWFMIPFWKDERVSNSGEILTFIIIIKTINHGNKEGYHFW
jgi:hypothetical protein